LLTFDLTTQYNKHTPLCYGGKSTTLLLHNDIYICAIIILMPSLLFRYISSFYIYSLLRKSFRIFSTVALFSFL